MRVFVVAVVCCVASVARAQGDDDVGFGDLPPAVSAPEASGSADDDAGFGDLPDAGAESAEEEPVRPSAFSLFGTLRENVGIAPERGTSHVVLARTTLDLAGRYRRGPLTLQLGLRAEVDPSYLIGNGRDDAPTRETYRGRVMPWETFIELRSREVTFAFGRQIVAWGNSQLVTLLDLPNPRDQRMPGLGQPADQRLPVTMTRLAIDHGAHRLELLGIHEVDYRFIPPPMSFYSPLPEILHRGSGIEASGFFEITADASFRYHHAPRRMSRGSQQVLARYRYIGSRAELGLYGGGVALADGTFSLPVLTDFQGDDITFRVEHARYGLVGASMLAARGDFTFFADGLVEIDRPVTVGDLDVLPPFVGRDRQSWARYVVGIRYAGIDSGFLALEHGFGLQLEDAHPLGDPIMPVAPPSIAGVYQQRFARERVEIEIAASSFGPRLRGGGVARAMLAYKPRDGVRIALAYVLFVPGLAPSPIAGFTKHDRVDLTATWDFATQ